MADSGLYECVISDGGRTVDAKTTDVVVRQEANVADNWAQVIQSHSPKRG